MKMNKIEKTTVLTAPAIAYASTLGGLEVKSLLEEGGDTYVSCVSGAWCFNPSAHRVKVQYTHTDIPFIKVNGVRVRLDEIIRV